MKRRRLTPAWIRGKIETLEALAEAAQMPPRRKAAAAAKWNGLLFLLHTDSTHSS
ncbi:hypothetical protein [Rossellomorea marisflavi]|uniref:hypothetical protein n=1 Tax=Rossellomorea marisflavi TaxID=189381 RepID=UPI0018CF33D3|nr:hypothetical protein [Rossellomorea marisflavi]